MRAITFSKVGTRSTASLIAFLSKPWRAIAAGFMMGALVVLVARATPFVMVGNLVTVSGTNDFPIVTAGVFNPVRGAYSFLHDGLTSTQALAGYLQLTVDGSNFITLATYTPSATNAITNGLSGEVFSPALSAVTYSYRLRIVTTNSLQVGVTGTF
jgi:hypothetical protein